MDAQKEQYYKEQLLKALQTIRQLKQDVEYLKAGHTDDEGIAIIGMGCRYPGGISDLDGYWKLLREGGDAIGDIPAYRWDVDAVYDPEIGTRGKMYVKRGGFIEDIDTFDASFFDISPREAQHFDPHFRLFLEVAYEAIEDAGITLSSIQNTPTAVMLGQTVSDYELRHLCSTDLGKIDAYSATGAVRSAGAGRVSFFFNLNGPNLSIEAACSSSLVAIHLACQSLANKESDLALAGGSNAITSPHNHIALSQMHGISPDGYCKTFDASANGYVRGEGCGIIVLKRLSDALRDKDRVWGVIRGSAVNHVGRSNGPTAPSTKSQVQLLRTALAKAGLSGNDIQYVEAHGTGTPLGDPIEMEALQQVYGKQRQYPLLVGSVKTNFGHTEGAAGVGGLIKAVLAMHHGKIPPHLHFHEPSPHIRWDGSVQVPTQLMDWPDADGQPRRAGISSFGIGGTNAHVLVEGPTPAIRQATLRETKVQWPQLLLPISAKTPQALQAQAQRYADFLRQTARTMADICASAALHRTHFQHRTAVLANDREKAIRHLESIAQQGTPASAFQTEDRPKVVFVFPGQGSQWAGMGQQLYKESQIFKESIDACETAFANFVDWSLVHELHRNDARFEEIDVIQPVLVAVEIALARLWQSIGIAPHAVVGHSMGEVAAAYIAGAISLDDAARIICTRSRLMKQLSGQGAMLLVELTVEEAEKAIGTYQRQVSVAVSNAKQSTVLSGDTEAIHAIMRELEAQDIFCRLVKVNVASHSPQMDAIKAPLKEALAGIAPRQEAIPFYSTVQASQCGGKSLDSDYWVDNLRNAVLFGQTVERLLGDGHTVFIEMTPHPVLLVQMQHIVQEGGWPAVAIPSLYRGKPEWEEFSNSIARLYSAGFPIDWAQFYGSASMVALPLYPWQKKRYWLGQSIRTEQMDDNATVNQYQDDAEAVGKSSIMDVIDGLEQKSAEQVITDILISQIALLTGLLREEIKIDTPFKRLGIDSLMYVQLRNSLRGIIGFDAPVKSFIEHNSIRLYASFLYKEMNGGNHAAIQYSLSAPKDVLLKDAQIRIKLEGTPYTHKTSSRRILLTGGTGFVGAYLLRAFLDSKPDSKVYCLVRASNKQDGYGRIADNLKKYRIWDDSLREKIEPIIGDLAHDRLGIANAEWDFLCQEIDEIYHIGAYVNWLLSYHDVARSNVNGTKELLSLASQRKTKAFHFVSTIATHSSFYHEANAIVYEDDLFEYPELLYGAYSQSKWVNEKMLMEARNQGVPVNIYRVGDILGDSTTGVGNQDDFIHIIVKACIETGLSPSFDMKMNFIPVDALCEGIILLSQIKGRGHNYHFNNDSISWNDLITQLNIQGANIRFSDFDDWMAAVKEKISKGNEAYAKLPPVFRPIGIHNGVEFSYWNLAEHMHSFFFDDKNSTQHLANTGFAIPPPHELLRCYFKETSLKPYASIECLSSPAKIYSRMFCFHHAGGSAMSFQKWKPNISDNMALFTVELPFRFSEARDENHRHDLAVVIQDIATQIASWSAAPYILFGHSMGGVLAFEVCRSLREMGIRLPSALIVSASPYPRYPHRSIGSLTNEQLMQLFPSLIQQTMGDAEYIEVILDALRQDIQLLSSYEYKFKPPLNIPIVALFPKQDGIVTYEHMQSWQEETHAELFQLLERPGEHDYYMNDGAYIIQVASNFISARGGIDGNAVPIIAASNGPNSC